MRPGSTKSCLNALRLSPESLTPHRHICSSPSFCYGGVSPVEGGLNRSQVAAVTEAIVAAVLDVFDATEVELTGSALSADGLAEYGVSRTDRQ